MGFVSLFFVLNNSRNRVKFLSLQTEKSIAKIFDTMKVLTLQIPDFLEVDHKQLAMILASRLYEQGKLSLGQAAEVAGLTKRTFAELLGTYYVSIFNFPVSDLSKDVANA